MTVLSFEVSFSFKFDDRNDKNASIVCFCWQFLTLTKDGTKEELQKYLI